MKKIYPTLLSAIILSMGSLAAQNALHKEIHLSTTGSLPKELSLEEAKGLTSIKVTGEINETDIALLNNMASAGKLEKIDLSEATFGETKDPGGVRSRFRARERSSLSTWVLDVFY